MIVYFMQTVVGLERGAITSVPTILSGMAGSLRKPVWAVLSARLWVRLVIFVLIVFLVLVIRLRAHFTGPIIDLVVALGIGVLTAFLAILAGHVATEKQAYRWMFYVAGALLAALFIVSGFRQYVSAMAALRNPTPEQIVMEAVTASSDNTAKAMDQAIDKANKHTDQKIHELHGDLKNTADTLSSTLSKQLESIRPSQTELAKLQFSFYASEIDKFPLLVSPLRPSNGTVVVEFMARNISNVQAKEVELWVQVCRSCSYVKEPEQFEKPSGTDDHVRHRVFGNLNAKIFTNKMMIEVRVPANVSRFDTSFDYACATCEVPMPWGQTLTTVVLH